MALSSPCWVGTLSPILSKKRTVRVQGACPRPPAWQHGGKKAAPRLLIQQTGRYITRVNASGFVAGIFFGFFSFGTFFLAICPSCEGGCRHIGSSPHVVCESLPTTIMNQTGSRTAFNYRGTLSGLVAESFFDFFSFGALFLAIFSSWVAMGPKDYAATDAHS